MSYNYLAFELEQKGAGVNAPKLYLFHAPASEILDWTEIDRLNKQNPSGIQRPTNRSRILSLRRFFSAPENVTPTAIVVAIEGASIETVSDCKLESGSMAPCMAGGRLVQISISQGITPKPAVLLDGQHRLLGANEWNPSTRLAVVALLNVDINETAFQFLVINNKAAKVPTDHMKAMLHGANYDQAILGARLKLVRLDVDDSARSVRVMDVDDVSPFKGMIKWPHNLDATGPTSVQTGFIPPAAIEIAIDSIAPRKMKDLQDDETIDDFFMTLWSTIKQTWPDIFVPPNRNGSRLLTKVGIICMTEFLVSRLREMSLSKHASFSMGDPDQVRRRTQELLEDLHPDFWTTQWRSTSYDTRAGRDQIIAALDIIRGNIAQGREWFTDVEMVLPPGSVPDE